MNHKYLNKYVFRLLEEILFLNSFFKTVSSVGIKLITSPEFLLKKYKVLF